MNFRLLFYAIWGAVGRPEVPLASRSFFRQTYSHTELNHQLCKIFVKTLANASILLLVDKKYIIIYFVHIIVIYISDLLNWPYYKINLYIYSGRMLFEIKDVVH